MFSTITLQDQIKRLEEVNSHEEQLMEILKIFMESYPVLNAYLFRYSPIGYLAEGIISLSGSGLTHIGHIRDDIRALPGIYDAIHERKAKFYSRNEVLKNLSSRYILDSEIFSLLVVPISFGTVVIGYIISDKMEKGIKWDEKLLGSISLYGRLVGEVLYKTNGSGKKTNLSKRELEVMKKVAWGDSTKEIADTLGISEITVKQYVKSAINKLGAQNRTHAVAELFRNGILS